MDYFISIGLLISIIILSLFLHKRKLSKKLKQLRDGWGKIPESRIDLESIKLYYQFNKTNSFENSYCIDDGTWEDLDFDEIFTLINRTTTPIGAQYLYNLLRHPLLESELLNKRETLINVFSNKPALREKVYLALHRLEDKNAKYLPYSLWKPLPEKPLYARIFPIISIISFSVLLLVLLNYLHFSVIVPIFIFNLILRSFIKRKIDIYVNSFQYLGVLISTADKIVAFKFDEFAEIQTILKENLKDTRSIAQDIFALQFRDEFGLFEYFNIYFLLDISGFYSAIDKIRKNLTQLKAIYETIGSLDSLISIASFRMHFNHFCHPLFIENNEKYRVKNIFNPLLQNPVSNSFEFNSKNILITGSNMAGKTTFLKTLGVNAVLAQTINMSFSEYYETPFQKVLSSIGRMDNLVLGKSYYLAEVESILRLLNASKTESIHLFILDEIFRGTNSVERLAASIEVLKYLANNKDFVLVATHDLQLTEILNHEYANYHFREQVCVEGLEFDYKLHPGPSTTRNAIALLDYVGYPESIIINASNRIKNNTIEQSKERSA
ncbi:hypothetical protein JXJ21_21485 [candidate division KSB1 bacterium]|nr:hypothetical protein [candidate division KSB1 bacterium]